MLEYGSYKLLWHFSAQTDREIEAKSPDLVISDKEAKRFLITDVPEEGKVSAKENEKAEKFQI